LRCRDRKRLLGQGARRGKNPRELTRTLARGRRRWWSARAKRRIAERLVCRSRKHPRKLPRLLLRRRHLRRRLRLKHACEFPWSGAWGRLGGFHLAGVLQPRRRRRWSDNGHFRSRELLGTLHLEHPCELARTRRRRSCLLGSRRRRGWCLDGRTGWRFCR